MQCTCRESLHELLRFCMSIGRKIFFLPSYNYCISTLTFSSDGLDHKQKAPSVCIFMIVNIIVYAHSGLLAITLASAMILTISKRLRQFFL